MKKLYVGNLSPATSEATVHSLFEKFGPVISCSLITDRFTGESKCFAFVELDSDANAVSAINELNDMQVDGSRIQVNEARPKREDGGGQWQRPGGSSNGFGNRRGPSDRTPGKRPGNPRRFR